MKSPITTHILDTSTGTPAIGVLVRLEERIDDTWHEIARSSTDNDGRILDWMKDRLLTKGYYRLVFSTHEYFAATKRESFFPQVTIEFEVCNPNQHYHVPLLLSPYSYSTYRGS
jgi:5-hydroxyisourate hydrolase